MTKIEFDPKTIMGPADRGKAEGKVAGRSPGLHLSQIYGDLEASWRKRMEPEMTEEELEFYRAGGWVWETIWSSAMAECLRTGEIVRPGEFMVDGVIGSPDNLRVDPWRVIETKCTWKSVRKWDTCPMEKWFWVWTVQVKGYCRMVGTREVELYAMFTNGDYRGSGPQTRAVLMKFEQLEIDENWGMLMGHAKRRGWVK